MGNRIYILIPICWGLIGDITALPLPFTVRQLVIIQASALFIFSYIFKTNRSKSTFETIDFWIWTNLAWLFFTFIRHPAGVAAIAGSDMVGGKRYVEVFLGLMAYLMLSRLKISPGFARQLPYWMFGAVFFDSFANACAMLFPGVSMHLAPLYNSFNSILNDQEGAAAIDVGETRLGFLQTLGDSLILLLVSKTDPTDLLSPAKLGQLFLYLSGLVMILLSGFRTAIILAFINTGIAAFVRERLDTVLKIVVLGITLVAAIVGLSYTDFQIPPTFQRALSFLPGRWDEDVVADAKGSSDWRFEMWQIVLTSDKYIHNKWLGDGFGYSRIEFEAGVNFMLTGQGAYSGSNGGQEAFMIDGDLHSGPVGSIRFVGYVGLVFILVLLCVLAAKGFRVIKETRGTPFQFCAMYIGIPAIVFPVYFVFFFGDYRSDFVTILFDAGMFKMIEASLRQYQEEKGLSKKAKRPVKKIPLPV